MFSLYFPATCLDPLLPDPNWRRRVGGIDHMLDEVSMEELAFWSIEKDRKDKMANPKGSATQHSLENK